MGRDDLGLTIGGVTAVCLQMGLAAPGLADSIELAFPLACELNRTCFIQNYVDMDSTSGAKDYRCGGATYDTHKGTDFRLLSVRDAVAGVAVLAAAPGRVKALRDGVKDRLIGKDVRDFAGKKCGNGVVIDHGGGWETQYCHMLQGSVRVRRNANVKRGEVIGSVGYSGKAQFSHLHLSVRKDGKIIDPFTGRTPGGLYGRGPYRGLWAENMKPVYDRGRLIEAGFTHARVSTRDLENGAVNDRPVSGSSGAIVFYARFINLESGDRIHLVLRGPNGILARKIWKPLDRHKA